MRMLRFFIEYEWRTQLRSVRFRSLAGAYFVLVVGGPVFIYLMAHRFSVLVGPGAYNAVLLVAQPLLTSYLAAALAIDAIARERDEGSFGVLSVAPISSAGYFFRRWLAVAVVCVVLSLLPTIVTVVLAIRNAEALPLVAMFGEAWLVEVLPGLLVSSLFAIALGTITGRTILGIILGLLVMSVGLGLANEVLFHVHLRFDGPDKIFGGSLFGIQRLTWLIGGHGFSDFPSDAAYPLRGRARMLIAHAGVGVAFIVLAVATAVFHLRRTKRDLRPWRISPTHQLRTMLHMFNRLRDDFSADRGATVPEIVTVIAACAFAVWMVAYLVHRQSIFHALAQARYVAETTEAPGTDPAVVADTLDVDAAVDQDGSVRSAAVVSVRNTGSQPQTRLSLDLNPLVTVTRMAASAGRLHAQRVWQRLDLTLDPPLTSGETRRLSFQIAGTPGDVDFNLQPPGKFPQRWTRYRTAPEPIYLTDLSRSSIDTLASEVQVYLHASDIVPVLRYARWELDRESKSDTFTRESRMTPTSLHLRLRHGYRIIADSCGAIARATLDSRCVASLPEYVVFGGPLVDRTISPGVSLAYIPAHATVARVHAQSLAGAVRLAADAWPGLNLPPHVTFVERPHMVGESEWYAENFPAYTVRQIGARGALIMVPEGLFTKMKSLNPSFFAAALLSGTLRAQRPVVTSQTSFFVRTFTSIAIGRLGIRRMRSVEPGLGAPPQTAPLLSSSYQEIRLARVLSAVEYRAGTTAFIAGINDFIKARGAAGTAKELIDSIGRRGGVDLSRMYDDYFAGSALPRLTLVDVTYRRSGDRWDVSGSVKNEATGETFVPVALRTAQGTQWQTIRVDTAQTVPFTFTTTADPRAVQLDPEQVVYRHAAIGTLDVVEYRGPS